MQGNNIAQTYQFVETGNAELGFVALSQVANKDEGSRWIVPGDLYATIAQDAVLLTTGADSEPAKAFLAFLKGPEAARDHGALRLRHRRQLSGAHARTPRTSGSRSG